MTLSDDGVSGTRFDRPGFMAMMEEVEDGGVEAIIVKDMSRLGRDYLKVGQVMEILRQRGVRLIAINDNVDTDRGDNDMTPFLNVKLTKFRLKSYKISVKWMKYSIIEGMKSQAFWAVQRIILQ